tara:strand:+ start:105 stop:518 length:414 start_codon:yes stop_codon:yes gene_type:complete
MLKADQIARVIDRLETLYKKLIAYTHGDILTGAILHSCKGCSTHHNENIDETIICLDTALQILNKRLSVHIEKEQEERELSYHYCETCHLFLSEGFVINGGEEYFCNAHEPTYFKELYEADPDGDTYWTQWDEEITL